MISTCGCATGLQPALPSAPPPLDPDQVARDKQAMSSKHIAIEPRSRLVCSICVYCGSVQGADLVFEAAARQLGQAMANAGIGLVYGGGANGLLGAIARSVVARRGAAPRSFSH